LLPAPYKVLKHHTSNISLLVLMAKSTSLRGTKATIFPCSVLRGRCWLFNL